MYQREFGNNHPVGRDRFEEMIDRYGLKVTAKVHKPRATDSTHGLPVYPNLTKDLIVMTPNQLWVSDMTYLVIWINKTESMFSYLLLILDAYTEEVVGWRVGPSLEAIYPIEALKMALIRLEGKSVKSLIHHSARGGQYASKEYMASYGNKASVLV